MTDAKVIRLPWRSCDCTDPQPSATTRPCGCVVCVTCAGIVEWGHDDSL